MSKLIEIFLGSQTLALWVRPSPILRNENVSADRPWHATALEKVENSRHLHHIPYNRKFYKVCFNEPISQKLGN